MIRREVGNDTRAAFRGTREAEAEEKDREGRGIGRVESEEE
jgi:hypothetical protein